MFFFCIFRIGIKNIGLILFLRKLQYFFLYSFNFHDKEGISCIFMKMRSYKYFLY